MRPHLDIRHLALQKQKSNRFEAESGYTTLAGNFLPLPDPIGIVGNKGDTNNRIPLKHPHPPSEIRDEKIKASLLVRPLLWGNGRQGEVLTEVTEAVPAPQKAAPQAGMVIQR